MHLRSARGDEQRCVLYDTGGIAGADELCGPGRFLRLRFCLGLVECLVRFVHRGCAKRWVALCRSGA